MEEVRVRHLRKRHSVWKVQAQIYRQSRMGRTKRNWSLWSGKNPTQDGEVYVPPTAPEPTKTKRAEINHVVKLFLAELSETAAFATQKKYRLMLNKFKEFSAARGYIMIDQWEPSDVREFRSSWKISPQTAARRMAMLKAFFEICVANEWRERNPARLITIRKLYRQFLRTFQRPYKRQLEAS